MAKFLSLITFTETGKREVSDTLQRAEEFRGEVEAVGAQVKGTYWAVGECDGCILLDAPDEETATALLLKLGQRGNVRTRTLRLYDKDEFEKVLTKV